MSVGTVPVDALRSVLDELDAVSTALASPRPADGARVLQLVGERQERLDVLARLLADVPPAALGRHERQQLERALARSSQLGELARRAVEEQARVVARELRALETLAASPDALAAVGRVDAQA